MDTAQLANLKEKIRDKLVDQDAHEPEYWTLEKMASLIEVTTPTSDDVRELIELCVEDHVWDFLPVIAGLLGSAARDSDEFAGMLESLERKTRGDMAVGPIANAVRSIGVADPEMALRIAKQLLKRDDPGYAYLLIGGAAPELPSECSVLMQDLLASDDARLQATAIESAIVAHPDSGYRAGWDVIESLERASESADARVRGATVSAFIEFYASDPQRCMHAIERMAGKHRECAWQLARRTWVRSPFDEETSLRLLCICSEFSDPSVKQEVHRALAKLASGHLEAVLQIVIKYVARDNHHTGITEYVLEQLGKAHGAKAVEALLGTPVKTAYMRLCAPALARSLISGVGDADALEPVFKAIESEQDPYGIWIQTLREVISNKDIGGTSRTDMLAATMKFLECRARDKGVCTSDVIKGEQDQAVICGLLIRAILDYHAPDYDLARENMRRFPELLSLFGQNWLNQNKKDGRTHPLLYSLEKELPSQEEIDTAVKRVTSAETPRERFNMAFKLNRLSGAWCFLHELDGDLRALREAGHNTAKYAKHLKNEQQFLSTLSEIDFVMQFLGKCEIKLEPEVGQNQLDARLEICGHQVYVEVFSPEMLQELQIFSGARGIRNRIPNQIYEKFKKQLRLLDGGGNPVILAIDIGRSEVKYDFVEDYLWGPLVGTFYVSQTGELIDRGTAREEAESMHERDPATDVISAVICYKVNRRDDLERWMEYKIITNPHACVKLDAPTIEFLEKCLGTSEADYGRAS